MTWTGKLAVVIAALLLVGAGRAEALTLQPVGSGFASPIYVTSDPGNPDRLFVVERGGAIQLIENGEVRPFASISSRVSTDGEGGLLSIALSPDFASSGRYFVYYTGKEQSPAEIHVAELVGTSSTPRNLLTIPHPNQDNHYGGQLQFGPEGNLFIATGDGGGVNDAEQNAQDLSSLLGKLLRINPNPSGSAPYTVPAGNPFAASPAPYDTIWSYGLRNPFRFSFDRLGGDLWIGDVGQDDWEEVDFAAAPAVGIGANYGWSCREGNESNPTSDPACGSAGPFVDPIFQYPNPAQGCAIIGGYVARGPGLGDLWGRYLYGDLCSGNIRSFALVNPGLTDRYEGASVGSLNSFGEDSCGRLYAVSGDGPVYRIDGPQAGNCAAAEAAPPLSASFVGIRALRRKVLRHKRTLITAWVSPCKGRRGDPVTLWRGRQRMGTRRLDRVCTVRFRPKINRRSRFRATAKADETYAAAISRKLTVKVKKRRPRG
ncbi:MAG TPA: PQQ-dependent sugar dehydrogenase [Solirubrobacterales bacterium]|nr:PQQ-dependent sugar dehydrogenase [Solirubrobacterales bacterium]